MERAYTLRMTQSRSRLGLPRATREIDGMKRLILAAVLVAAAVPAAAETSAGFNPGMVVSNVLENPPPGCVLAFGITCNAPPGPAYYDYAPNAARHVKKAAPARH